MSARVLDCAVMIFLFLYAILWKKKIKLYNRGGRIYIFYLTFFWKEDCPFLYTGINFNNLFISVYNKGYFVQNHYYQLLLLFVYIAAALTISFMFAGNAHTSLCPPAHPSCFLSTLCLYKSFQVHLVFSLLQP